MQVKQLIDRFNNNNQTPLSELTPLQRYFLTRQLKKWYDQDIPHDNVGHLTDAFEFYNKIPYEHRAKETSYDIYDSAMFFREQSERMADEAYWEDLHDENFY